MNDSAEHDFRQMHDALASLLALPPEQRSHQLSQMGLPGPLVDSLREALLAVEHTGLLDRPLEIILQQRQGHTPPAPKPGDKVGEFVLLAPLGQGGMADVFLAQRHLGESQQQVAIKVIRPELVSPLLRQRFQEEQRILARLQHPGIAGLIDAGICQHGEPFLAMEHVDGEPLLDWCAQQKLGIRARLRLFLRVLEAVDYAHRHMVVHRDLKPGNILVRSDGTPALLDFGIARLLEQRQNEEHTATQWRMLSRHYAAPEQLAGGPVSSAMDIYALGVILFQMLCGQRPDRQKPHTFWPNISPAAASERGLSADQLRRQLTGDLQAIVQHCLAEQPQQRYHSAAELMADIANYLDCRPLSVRRPSWYYRAGKFLRRHRLASIGTGLGLLLATASATAWWSEAQQRQLQSDRASAAEHFLQELFASAAPRTAGSADLTVAELLDHGVQRARAELADRPALAAHVLLSIAESQHALSQHSQADATLGLAKQKLEQHKDPILQAQLWLTLGANHLDRGEREPARDYLQRALTSLQQMAPQSTLHLRALIRMGILARADEDYEQAERLLKQAIALAEQQPQWRSQQLSALNELGIVLIESEHYQRALDTLQQAIDLSQQHFDPSYYLAILARSSRSHVLTSLGRWREAEAELAALQPLFIETMGEQHPDRGYHLLGLAMLQRQMGLPLEAIDNMRQARDLLSQAFVAEAVELAIVDAYLATTWHRLGALDRAMAKLEPAWQAIVQALGPESLRSCLAGSALAQLRLDRGELAAAETWLLEQQDYYAEGQVGRVCQSAWMDLRGELAVQHRDYPQAIQDYQQSLALESMDGAVDQLSSSLTRVRLAELLWLNQQPEQANRLAREVDRDCQAADLQASHSCSLAAALLAYLNADSEPVRALAWRQQAEAFSQALQMGSGLTQRLQAESDQALAQAMQRRF